MNFIYEKLNIYSRNLKSNTGDSQMQSFQGDKAKAMPEDSFFHSKDKVLYRVNKNLTLLAIGLLLLAICYNISTGLLLAAKINITAYILISLNFLYGKKENNYKKSFIFNVLILGSCLLLHQFFYGHINILTNIWMILFPIYICRYRGKKEGLKFTIILSFLVGIVLYMSLTFNSIEYYAVSTIEKDISAFVALVFALFASYTISNIFLREESRHLAHIRESLEENRQLVSILTHDISNQLTIQKLATHKLTKINSDQKNINLIKKIDKSTDNLSEIVKIVRHTKTLRGLTLEVARTDQYKILETLKDELINSSNIPLEYISIQNNCNTRLQFIVDTSALVTGVLLPLFEHFHNCKNHSLNDQLIVRAKEGRKFNSLVISSAALDIFQTPSISHEKFTTLNEKKIIIGIISAKKIVKRFGGEIKIVINKSRHNELQLNFKKSERSIY